MNDLDNEPSQEGPLPFWLKALAIMMLVPFINSVVPGSVVAVFTTMGFPDPSEYGKEETQPMAVSAPAPIPPDILRDRFGE